MGIKIEKSINVVFFISAIFLIRDEVIVPDTVHFTALEIFIIHNTIDIMIKHNEDSIKEKLSKSIFHNIIPTQTELR